MNTPRCTRCLIAAVCVLLSGFTQAAPTLIPNSGLISESGQAFSYAANGTAVSSFWIYIGTGASGASSYNILNSGGLEPSDSTISAPSLPGVTIYLTLWYQVSGSWLSDTYNFEVDSASTGETLLAELGCGIDEIIKSTSDGWDCVPISSFQGVEGPVGPQGPAGPAGPTTTTSAVCLKAGVSPVASCSCPGTLVSRVTWQDFNGSGLDNNDERCSATSDTGTCFASATPPSNSASASTGACCVCAQ